MITVYSKENCPQCVQAKQYLTLRGQEFQEIQVAYPTTVKVDGKLYIDLEEFKAKYPLVRAMPFIVDADGKEIGSFAALRDIY